AINAVSAGQVIELQTGVYRVATALTIGRSLTLRGRNRRSSELRWTGTGGTLLTVASTTTHVILESFQFNNSGTGAVGIQINGYNTILYDLYTSPIVKWSTAAIDTLT